MGRQNIPAITSQQNALTVSTPSLPRAAILALGDNPFSLSCPWDAAMAATALRTAGINAAALADELEQSILPAPHNWLIDRLSTLWALMSFEGSENKATVWLSEMRRLLGDLPMDILHDAIDEACKASDRGFMPSVGAIRKFADPNNAKRRLQATRARLIAELESARSCQMSAPIKASSSGPEVTAEEFAQLRKEMEKALRANPSDA